MLASFWIELAGYLACMLVFMTFCMRRLLPLRLLAIASNLAFILYALLAGLMPILLLHATLLPLNLWRGIEAFRERTRPLTSDRSREAVTTALMPHMKRRDLKAGSHLFTRGDDAVALYYLAHGRVMIAESGTCLTPGALFGETGLFTPTRQRTASAHCLTDCTVFVADRATVERVAQTTPALGLYLAERIAARLVPHRAPAPFVLNTPVLPSAPRTVARGSARQAMHARGEVQAARP
jgi:CRP-like cAMP-binding protein